MPVPGAAAQLTADAAARVGRRSFTLPVSSRRVERIGCVIGLFELPSVRTVCCQVCVTSVSFDRD